MTKMTDGQERAMAQANWVATLTPEQRSNALINLIYHCVSTGEVSFRYADTAAPESPEVGFYWDATGELITSPEGAA